MGRATNSTTLGIRRASAVTAWLLWAVMVPAASHVEGEGHVRVQLTFGVDVPRLEDVGAIRRWVATDLHRRLGLDDTDAVTVDRGRPLGNYRVVRLTQTARGVPVLYRESRLPLNGDSEPVRLVGYHSPLRDAPAPYPRLSVVDAASIAGGREQDNTLRSRLVFQPAAETVRLSYELEGAFPHAAHPTAPAEKVYVDALTGQILDRLPLTRGALYRRIHDFAQACRDLGVDEPVNHYDRLVLLGRSPIVRSETVDTGGRSAERLFDLFRSIYSFFDLLVGLDSYDGAGAPVIAYLGVRYHENEAQCIGDEFNAQWDTSQNQMLLPVSALHFPEVVAHEFMHGVTSNGSGLLYRNQPGALSEAISDAVGVTFAAWLRAGAPADANFTLRMTSRDWQLYDPSGPMRDMRNPASVGDYPDHYDHYRWDLLPTWEHDYGGVHINSSIINQGFYLLAHGGRHPSRPRDGPVVEGVGAMRAARIFAAAAASVLSSNSSFEDARGGFADAAAGFHGEDSREWVAVHTALDAVGIPGHWDPPRESAPAPTPAPVADPEPVADPVAAPADSAPESKAVLVVALIGGLAVLGAVGVMLRSRSARASVALGAGPEARSNRPPSVAHGPDSTPPSTAHEEAVLGTLRPADGDSAIRLPEKLLSSREGMVIGRNTELCHLEIPLAAVSRRHLRLRATRGAIRVEDLNSLEGTQLDGIDLKPFKPQPITSGQTLSIGGSAFRFQEKVEVRFRR